MDESVKWYNSQLIDKTAKALLNNKYNEVRVADNTEETKKILLDAIKPGMKIAAGGSVTLKQLGILEELKARGNTVIQHTVKMDFSARKSIWKEALLADVYMASPQAVSVDGKLFFIDKYGNRAAGTIFGPGKIILIAGYNKIALNEQDAHCRMKNVASVMNAHRLNTRTPCVTTGVCNDCDSEERICGVMTIFHKKPAASDYLIILVNETLGF